MPVDRRTVSLVNHQRKAANLNLVALSFALHVHMLLFQLPPHSLLMPINEGLLPKVAPWCLFEGTVLVVKSNRSLWWFVHTQHAVWQHRCGAADISLCKLTHWYYGNYCHAFLIARRVLQTNRILSKMRLTKEKLLVSKCVIKDQADLLLLLSLVRTCCHKKLINKP